MIQTFRSPEDPKKSLVKRIVGLPGDKIRTCRGRGPKVLVPAGRCWIEGDNEANSNDSNTYGPVPIALIDARAMFIFWPPQHIGKLNRKKIESKEEDEYDSRRKDI